MICFKCRKLLIPYAEGNLEERVRAAVERHIARCKRCRQELDCITAVSGELRRAENPPMEPAPDLWEKVSARIADESPASQGRRVAISVPYAVSAGAAAVLVAVIGFSLVQPELPRTVPEASAPRTNMAAAPESPPDNTNGRLREPAGDAASSQDAVGAVGQTGASEGGRDLPAAEKPTHSELGQPKPAPPARPPAEASEYGLHAEARADNSAARPYKSASSAAAAREQPKVASEVGETGSSDELSGYAAADGSRYANGVLNRSMTADSSPGPAASSPAPAGAGSLACGILKDAPHRSIEAEEFAASERRAAGGAAEYLPKLTPVELNNYALVAGDVRSPKIVNGDSDSSTADSCYFDRLSQGAGAEPDSVVDEISELEGDRIAALFMYP